MKIRKILFQILGFEKYLKLLSYIFLQTYCWKWKLKEHFQVNFLPQLVKKGDVCIDIGANLGYFTVPLSRIVGDEGKILSVEPVSTYREVLMQNVARFALQNVEILPFALGDEDEKNIKLGTLQVDGMVRHGMTGILQNNSQQAVIQHEAIMMKPTTLFKGLTRLDFVKCDVEGFELFIIPEFLPIFEKFLPTLEIEMGSEESKQRIQQWMNVLEYKAYYLENQKLHLIDSEEIRKKEFEWYFVHETKKNNFIID
jgi:FkbM family methyltransferase